MVPRLSEVGKSYLSKVAKNHTSVLRCRTASTAERCKVKLCIYLLPKNLKKKLFLAGGVYKLDTH